MSKVNLFACTGRSRSFVIFDRDIVLALCFVFSNYDLLLESIIPFFTLQSMLVNSCFLFRETAWTICFLPYSSVDTCIVK